MSHKFTLDNLALFLVAQTAQDITISTEAAGYEGKDTSAITLAADWMEKASVDRDALKTGSIKVENYRITLPSKFSLKDLSNVGCNDALILANICLQRTAGDKQQAARTKQVTGDELVTVPGFRVEWGTEGQIFFKSKDNKPFDLEVLKTHLREAGKLISEVRRRNTSPEVLVQRTSINDIITTKLEERYHHDNQLGKVQVLPGRSPKITIEVLDRTYSRNNYWEGGKSQIESDHSNAGTRLHVFKGPVADRLCKELGIAETFADALKTYPLGRAR